MPLATAFLRQRRQTANATTASTALNTSTIQLPAKAMRGYTSWSLPDVNDSVNGKTYASSFS